MYAYVNGEVLPDKDATVSVFDRGLTSGDAVFDATRTFGGVPFKLEAHLDRLRKSLNYMELDGAAIVAEVRGAVAEVVDQNKEEIHDCGDVVIVMIVTRGPAAQMMLNGGLDKVARPTTVVFLRQLDYGAMAELYESGVDLGVSLSVRHFQGAIDPRVKSTNRLEAARGEMKGARRAQSGARGTWTLVFGDDGSVSESRGANICIVEGSSLVRPPRYEALCGISLETVCELGEELGLSVEERKLWVYDLINADEVLLSASSFSVFPVVTLDGIDLKASRKVYSQIVSKWIELVGVDFVEQCRSDLRSGV